MSKKIITIVFITLFSILLWVFISLSGEYFYNVKLPINFSDVPQGYAVSDYSTDQVSINLKGVGWQLAQMTMGSEPEFMIPVSAEPGIHKVIVRNAIEKNRWLSSKVQVNEVSPTEISYKIEKRIEKKVPVKPNLQMNFKEGYGLISDVTVAPESVVVDGPESKLDKLESISTVVKNYNSLTQSKVENIPLQQEDNLEYNTDFVKVSFNVQKIVDKEFQDIRVVVKNIPPSKNLTVFPETINVILRGGINLLGKLDKNDIKVSVNFHQAIKDTLGYLVPVIEVPKYTTFVDSEPSRLEYVIQQL